MSSKLAADLSDIQSDQPMPQSVDNTSSTSSFCQLDSSTLESSLASKEKYPKGAFRKKVNAKSPQQPTTDDVKLAPLDEKIASPDMNSCENQMVEVPDNVTVVVPPNDFSAKSEVAENASENRQPVTSEPPTMTKRPNDFRRMSPKLATDLSNIQPDQPVPHFVDSTSSTSPFYPLDSLSLESFPASKEKYPEGAFHRKVNAKSPQQPNTEDVKVAPMGEKSSNPIVNNGENQIVEVPDNVTVVVPNDFSAKSDVAENPMQQSVDSTSPTTSFYPIKSLTLESFLESKEKYPKGVFCRKVNTKSPQLPTTDDVKVVPLDEKSSNPSVNNCENQMVEVPDSVTVIAPNDFSAKSDVTDNASENRQPVTSDPFTSEPPTMTKESPKSRERRPSQLEGVDSLVEALRMVEKLSEPFSPTCDSLVAMDATSILANTSQMTSAECDTANPKLETSNEQNLKAQTCFLPSMVSQFTSVTKVPKGVKSEKKQKESRNTPSRSLRDNCPPFCKPGCSQQHHELLQAARRTAGRNDFENFKQIYAKYYCDKNGWQPGDTIFDPVKKLDIPLLYWMSLMGKVGAVKFLIEEGHDPLNVTLEDKKNVLHILVKWFYNFNCTHGWMDDLMKRFLKLYDFFECCLDQTDSMGRTPLHCCAEEVLEYSSFMVPESRNKNPPTRRYKFPKDLIREMITKSKKLLKDSEEMAEIADMPPPENSFDKKASEPLTPPDTGNLHSDPSNANQVNYTGHIQKSNNICGTSQLIDGSQSLPQGSRQHQNSSLNQPQNSAPLNEQSTKSLNMVSKSSVYNRDAHSEISTILNMVDNNGDTVMHILSKDKGSIDLVYVMESMGADLDIVNKEGVTARSHIIKTQEAKPDISTIKEEQSLVSFEAIRFGPLKVTLRKKVNNVREDSQKCNGSNKKRAHKELEKNQASSVLVEKCTSKEKRTCNQLDKRQFPEELKEKRTCSISNVDENESNHQILDRIGKSESISEVKDNISLQTEHCDEKRPNPDRITANTNSAICSTVSDGSFSKMTNDNKGKALAQVTNKTDIKQKHNETKSNSIIVTSVDTSNASISSACGNSLVKKPNLECDSSDKTDPSQKNTNSHAKTQVGEPSPQLSKLKLVTESALSRLPQQLYNNAVNTPDGQPSASLQKPDSSRMKLTTLGPDASSFFLTKLAETFTKHRETTNNSILAKSNCLPTTSLSSYRPIPIMPLVPNLNRPIGSSNDSFTGTLPSSQQRPLITPQQKSFEKSVSSTKPIGGVIFMGSSVSNSKEVPVVLQGMQPGLQRPTLPVQQQSQKEEQCCQSPVVISQMHPRFPVNISSQSIRNVTSANCSATKPISLRPLGQLYPLSIPKNMAPSVSLTAACSSPVITNTGPADYPRFGGRTLKETGAISGNALLYQKEPVKSSAVAPTVPRASIQNSISTSTIFHQTTPLTHTVSENHLLYQKRPFNSSAMATTVPNSAIKNTTNPSTLVHRPSSATQLTSHSAPNLMVPPYPSPMSIRSSISPASLSSSGNPLQVLARVVSTVYPSVLTIPRSAATPVINVARALGPPSQQLSQAPSSYTISIRKPVQPVAGSHPAAPLSGAHPAAPLPRAHPAAPVRFRISGPTQVQSENIKVIKNVDEVMKELRRVASVPQTGPCIISDVRSLNRPTDTHPRNVSASENRHELHSYSERGQDMNTKKDKEEAIDHMCPSFINPRPMPHKNNVPRSLDTNKGIESSTLSGKKTDITEEIQSPEIVSTSDEQHKNENAGDKGEFDVSLIFLSQLY